MKLLEKLTTTLPDHDVTNHLFVLSRPNPTRSTIRGVILRPDGGFAVGALVTFGGDTVRTLRMAIQMLRQLRTVLSGDYKLIDTLAEAIVCINRDEVDAKRQFELG